MKGPLEGIKVIEMAHWLVGPIAGCMLGDLGADVVKVEERIHGDGARGLTHVATQKIKRGYAFEFANRSKRSITLDITKQKGKELLYQLVRQADVFLTNFRPGIPERLGVDYETLSRYNPRLIYAQGSGWGLKGPFAKQPAYAPIMEARSGLAKRLAPPGQPPVALPGAIGDVITSIVLVPAILAALLAREKLGTGQKVDVSGLGSALTLQTATVNWYFINGEEEEWITGKNTGNPLYLNHKCADDRWISLGMLQSDRYWSSFCEAMGLKHIEKDPRFDNADARRENREELLAILRKTFATRTLSEWMEQFEGRDLIYGPVQSAPELVTDPQVIANEYIIDFDHPKWGALKLLGFPYKFSKTPAVLQRGAAPELGQHTEEVLLEMGYDWDDITRLKDEEVI